MSRTVLQFSISLDGFVAGRDTSDTDPLGIGGERLHEWMFAERPDPTDKAIMEAAFNSARAVVVGHRTYIFGKPHWGDTPYPVPSFVVTHTARPPEQMKSAAFTFVTTGIADAVSAARSVAGDGAVVIMGAHIARQTLIAGLADEMQLQLVPILLREGERLFDGVDPARVEIIQTRSVPTTRVTHLFYSVKNKI